jgi:hypothetical protein
MLSIAKIDIERRIRRDNPWWADPNSVLPEDAYLRRVYFASFKALALNFDVDRKSVV